jgi:hypothetical protein
MSPQSPVILIYRMMDSTHLTNLGRTFAMAILRSDPMNLHGWKVQWSLRLWCRLHTMFTARVQAREIAIRRTLLCVAMLHGWAHRMATDTHPSSDHSPCSLTCVLAFEAFTSMAMPLGLWGCSFSDYLYARFKYFLLINAVFIFVNNQNLPWSYLFFTFCIF